QWMRLPAPYPVPFWLQRVSLLRWVTLTMAHHTFACAVHRCLLDGIPGERLPGSAVYPRFRLLRTSRRSGGYAVTPAPGGRGFHPGEWPPLCQAASSRADSEAVLDTGGAGAVVTSCPRLSHCWASQPLQS